MARKATPQEKKVYDTIVLQALRFFMQKEQAARLEEMAKSSDPAEAIATSTATVIKQIVQAAKDGGHALTMTYIKPAAKEVMSHLIEMLVAFKDIPQEQAGQVLQQAIQLFDQITGGGQQAPQQSPQNPQQMPQQSPQAGGLLAQGA